MIVRTACDPICPVVAGYAASALLIVMCLAYYGDQDYVGTTEQGVATFILLLTYGGSMIPLMYLCSHVFDTAASAQIGLIVLNLVCGFM